MALCLQYLATDPKLRKLVEWRLRQVLESNGAGQTFDAAAALVYKTPAAKSSMPVLPRRRRDAAAAKSVACTSNRAAEAKQVLGVNSKAQAGGGRFSLSSLHQASAAKQVS